MTAFKTTHLRRVRPLAVLLAVAALAGCAALAPQTPEQTVTERANARWAALIKGDYKQAYQYMTPGYRAVRTAEDFRMRVGNAVHWQSAKVESVRCADATNCIARIRIDAKPMVASHFGDTITVYADEPWIQQDRRWWMFQKL